MVRTVLPVEVTAVMNIQFQCSVASWVKVRFRKHATMFDTRSASTGGRSGIHSRAPSCAQVRPPRRCSARRISESSPWHQHCHLPPPPLLSGFEDNSCDARRGSALVYDHRFLSPHGGFATHVRTCGLLRWEILGVEFVLTRKAFPGSPLGRCA